MDSVVRTVYYKYPHPKEVYIGKGVIARPFGVAVARLQAKAKAATAALMGERDGKGGSGGISLNGSLTADAAAAAVNSVDFSYARGCTLTLSRPAVPLLSTGAISYPLNRPVAALSEFTPKRAPNAPATNVPFLLPGRVVALGSGELFTDDWIGKEHNAAVADAMFRWLAHSDGGMLLAAAGKSGGLTASSGLSGVGSNTLRGSSLPPDPEYGEVDRLLSALGPASAVAAAAESVARRGRERAEKGAGTGGFMGDRAGAAPVAGSGSVDQVLDTALYSVDHVHLPDTQSLSERLRSCLQESEPLPRDFNKLFEETSVFGFDTRTIPEAVGLYNRLGVRHENLTLIPPQFETPLPQLQPAVFPPTMRELPPPALELFDLDETFSSERARLAQVTNKCAAGDGGAGGADDLEYYVKEAGIICGITIKVEQQLAAQQAAANAASSAVAAAGQKALGIAGRLLQHSSSTNGAAPLVGGEKPKDAPQASPKDILYYVLRHLAMFKRLNQDAPMAGKGDRPATPTNALGGVPGASSPLRHGPGAAGLWAGVGAGFSSKS
jgi:intraflagellar transport protein 52